MTKKNILLFRICKQWFQKILDGEMEHFKYREVKNYWESRLLDSNGTPKDFDEVHIKNGYKTDSPLARVEFIKIHGIVEYEGKDCFKIELGNVIEIIR